MLPICFIDIPKCQLTQTWKAALEIVETAFILASVRGLFRDTADLH